jgi:mannose PTS system EIIA component
MIGLVLVSHGRLAEELRSAMEHVVGHQDGVATVCIFPEDTMESRREDIRGAIAKVDTGDGVVVLTDIMGGTPSNLASQLCDHRKVEMIAKIRGSEPLAEAVAHATAAGRKYLASAAEVPDPAKPNGSGPPPAQGSAPKGAGP